MRNEVTGVLPPLLMVTVYGTNSPMATTALPALLLICTPAAADGSSGRSISIGGPGSTEKVSPREPPTMKKGPPGKACSAGVATCEAKA